MRTREYRNAGVDSKESSGRGLICRAAVPLIPFIIAAVLLYMTRGTFASYRKSESERSEAMAAGYAVELELQETDSKIEIVQNDAWRHDRLIVVKNHSETAVAYNITISLVGEEKWPEGITAVLLIGDDEKAASAISGNACIFTDDRWRLEQGAQEQIEYGLKLNTTYAVPSGDYRFEVSSFTWQAY